jgi:hypothetical protein
LVPFLGTLTTSLQVVLEIKTYWFAIFEFNRTILTRW